MKKYKKVKLLLLAVVYLSICFAIGQYRNQLKKSANNATQEENNDSAWTSYTSFEGVQETADTPWNFNAGIIDMEGEGSCILLLPNTAVVLTNIDTMAEEETLTLSYEIHPWVSASSDGAGLIVWLMDGNDNILLEQEVTVDADADWDSFSVDLTEYPNAQKIKLLCNNGGNDNDSGDWVVVKHGQ